MRHLTLEHWTNGFIGALHDAAPNCHDGLALNILKRPDYLRCCGATENPPCESIVHERWLTHQEIDKNIWELRETVNDIDAQLDKQREPLL